MTLTLDGGFFSGAAPDGDFAGRSLAEWRSETRRELGLPGSEQPGSEQPGSGQSGSDGPVIATGHQATFWHPGILTKDLLADRLADALGGTAVHLTVDQDVGGFNRLDLPVRTSDGVLAVYSATLAPARDGVPVECHPPVPGFTLPRDGVPALPSVRSGAEKIDQALRRHANAPNAAEQMARALADLRRPFVRQPLVSLRASQLLETTFGGRLLDAMARDPQACAHAYNRAVRQVPAAGMIPLLIRDDWVELPFWRLREDDRRQRGYDDDIERWREGGTRLRPRALLMTAIMRLVGCDLFIHGLGGANYDGVTERWIRDWLGLKLVPTTVASADLRLPLMEEGASVTPEELDDIERASHRAAQVARRAWHDPEPIKRGAPPGPGPVKRDLLSAIAAAPRGSEQRYRAYRAMHEQIARLRSRHVGRVEHAQRCARESVRRLIEARIAVRRDWPFPFAEDETIAALATTELACL